MGMTNSYCKKHMMFVDATEQALHDRLAQQNMNSVGCLFRDELAFLLQSTKRSYQKTFYSWMLEAYGGEDMERETKGGGIVTIPRVRLSILGCIPPDVLRENTTQNDWSTGFLPRFTFWYSSRQGYKELEKELPKVQEQLQDWMFQNIYSPATSIVISAKGSRVILDWVQKQVEEKRMSIDPNLFSVYTRLRNRAFRFAAMIALSHQTTNNSRPRVKVTAKHCALAIRMVEITRKSTTKLFESIIASDERREDASLIDAIRIHPGSSVQRLSEITGKSYFKTARTLKLFEDTGLVRTKETKRSGRGRPGKRYFLNSDQS